jgi:4,5-DOPA dioxygenase extradiol
MNTVAPALFLSHGSPMIAIEPGQAGMAMQAMGRAIDGLFGRPTAIVVMSAHTGARSTLVLSAKQHSTVHDFGGFPQALFDVRYDAPGSETLAVDVADALQQADPQTQVVTHAGLDHGIWTTLVHLYPQADVPVVPVSLASTATPEYVMRLGQTLSTLRQQGVLVIGSGSLTHNLRRFFSQPLPVDAPEMADCAAFRQWVLERTLAKDWAALKAYRSQAPHALEMHPTDEHWLPFYFAAGAGCDAGADAPSASVRVHASVTHGHLAMDAYAFGQGAQTLKTALDQAA